MHTTTFRRRPMPFARACLLAAALAGLAPTASWATCTPNCISSWSVVHAAGGEGFEQAIAKIEFEGNALAAGSEAAIGEVARLMKALGPKAVLKLRVSADGQSGAPARALVRARATALKQAFVKAGLPAHQLAVRAS